MSMLTRHGWRCDHRGELAGACSTTASAAVTDLAIDDTAQLSPGMLHATLTGSLRCDPGDFSPFFNSLSGQISQGKGGAGFGSTVPTCDGSVQPFSMDIASGSIFGGSGPFKAGKASAQVSVSTCDPITFLCSSQYVDAVIRLKKWHREPWVGASRPPTEPVRVRSSARLAGGSPRAGAVRSLVSGAAGVPRRHEALSRHCCARRRRPVARGPRRRDLRARGPVGLRQDDRDADGQPDDRHHLRRHPARRAQRQGPQARRSCAARSATSSSRSGCSRTGRSATTSRPSRACSAGTRRASRARVDELLDLVGLEPARCASATRRSSRAASASASASPARSPSTRR